VELRAGHGDEGLLGGGQRRCGVLVLFCLREEVLGELVEVDGGASKDEAVAAGDGAASARRRRGVAWSGGLGCFGPQMGVGIRWRCSALGPVARRGFGQGGLGTACCRGRLFAARTETRDAALLGQSGHSAWRHSR
jgi:hypothetical protein